MHTRYQCLFCNFCGSRNFVTRTNLGKNISWKFENEEKSKNVCYKNYFCDSSTASSAQFMFDLQALWCSRTIRYFQNVQSRQDNYVKIVVAHQRKHARSKIKVYLELCWSVWHC